MVFMKGFAKSKFLASTGVSCKMQMDKVKWLLMGTMERRFIVPSRHDLNCMRPGKQQKTLYRRQIKQSGWGPDVTPLCLLPCKNKIEEAKGSAHLMEAGRSIRGWATGNPPIPPWLPLARSPGDEREEEQKGSTHLMEAGRAVRGRAGGGTPGCDGRGVCLCQVECIAQQCQGNNHTRHAAQHQLPAIVATKLGSIDAAHQSVKDL